jgi:hypothetical protein
MPTLNRLHLVRDCRPTLVAQLAGSMFLVPADEVDGRAVFMYWIMFFSDCSECLIAAKSPAWKIGLN